ncbi:uncharacterized protein LOC120712398 [Panicum virgatum]|nr:uncharacterized protein LOC120712398 [Panicum virgatum]
MAATGEDAAARARGALSTTAEVASASGLRAGAREDDEQAHAEPRGRGGGRELVCNRHGGGDPRGDAQAIGGETAACYHTIHVLLAALPFPSDPLPPPRAEPWRPVTPFHHPLLSLLCPRSPAAGGRPGGRAAAAAGGQAAEACRRCAAAGGLAGSAQGAPGDARVDEAAIEVQQTGLKGGPYPLSQGRIEPYDGRIRILQSASGPNIAQSVENGMNRVKEKL